MTKHRVYSIPVYLFQQISTVGFIQYAFNFDIFVLYFLLNLTLHIMNTFNPSSSSFEIVMAYPCEANFKNLLL